MTRFRPAGFAVFFLCALSLPSPESHAFWKFNKEKAYSGISQTPEFRIYYKSDPLTTRQDTVDPQKKWVLLAYKVVDRAEQPGILKSWPGGKVRFLDAEGFALASDIIFGEDFQGIDFYGTLWMEQNRAPKIVSADIVKASYDEALWQKQKKKEAKEAKEADEKAVIAIPEPPPAPSLAPSPEPSPSLVKEVSSEIPPQPSPLPAPANSPGAEAIQTVPNPSPSASPSPLPTVTPSPDASAATQVAASPVSSPSPSPALPAPEDPLLGNGGADNQEVEKVLAALNQKLAPLMTQAAESASEEDDSAEDAAAVEEKTDPEEAVGMVAEG